MTTLVIASKRTFNSSAAICLYAVCAVVWPKSTLPVRMRMVLSALISNHDAGNVGSIVFLLAAASAVDSSNFGPAKLNPTINTPPVLTNWRRVNAAPYTLMDWFLAAIAHLAFALTFATRWTASMIADEL